jgi:hypothetical protein
MPDSNEKPSFRNLRQRIVERAASGRNVVLSPSTAMQIAAALGVAHQASLQHDFNFTVEQWSADGLHVEEVMAQTRNVLLARPAFEAAVTLRPKNILFLPAGDEDFGKVSGGRAHARPSAEDE